MGTLLPTGNMRAPTLRFGRLILVGFNEKIYEQFLSRGAVDCGAWWVARPG